LYFTVFMSAFIAASLFPAQSEAVLVYQISANPNAIASLVVVATIGNVFGSVVNWWFGRFAETFKNRSWFPFSEDKVGQAQRHYRQYGRYSLLFSWVPFIGDPITIVAGMMREPLWSFIIFVTIAKSARYLFVAGLASALFT